MPRLVHQRSPRREGFVDIGAMPPDALITQKQLAQICGFTVPALRKWARCGRGPRIVRIEGCPRYRVADVREWLRGDRAAA